MRTSGLDIRLVAGVVLAGACERPLVDVDVAEELALDRVLVPRAQRCVCTHTLLLYIHCPSKWARMRKGEKETEPKTRAAKPGETAAIPEVKLAAEIGAQAYTAPTTPAAMRHPSAADAPGYALHRPCFPRPPIASQAMPS